MNKRVVIPGMVVGAAIGLAAGVGGYTFVYARGSSYLTDDPAACANCHVMRHHYVAWARSSHHTVAVCNDCHTPHPFLAKYAVKARNGFHHSLAFTTGRFPEPIRISEYNRAVAEAACRRCHGDVVQAIDTVHRDAGGGPPEHAATRCTRCHDQVGHLY